MEWRVSFDDGGFAKVTDLITTASEVHYFYRGAWFSATWSSVVTNEYEAVRKVVGIERIK
jgi:hypothetical protein